MGEFRVAMMSTCSYPQWGNVPLQGLERCILIMGAPGAVSGPSTDLQLTIGTISPVMNCKVGKEHSGETDQLTLTNGGSEHT